MLGVELCDSGQVRSLHDLRGERGSTVQWVRPQASALFLPHRAVSRTGCVTIRQGA